MTLNDFHQVIALRMRITSDEARKVARAFTDSIKTSMRIDDRLCIPGFGIFYRKHRKASSVLGIDGQWHDAPSSVSIGFKASSAVKKTRRGTDAKNRGSARSS